MSIQILDNYFSFNQQNFIYNYCRNSRFKIGWHDSDDLDKQNYKSIHSPFTYDEYLESGLKEGVDKISKLTAEPVNIVEGAFDAISTGDNTIPLFGKTLSKSLIQAIVSNKPPRINLILDNDALTMAISHAEKFLSYGLNTYIVELPGKDPNELGQEAVQQLINNTEKLTFSKLMEYKLYAR